MSMNYLLELFKNIDIGGSIGVRSNIDSLTIIYEMSLAPVNPNSFFINKWGGSSTRIDSNLIQLYYGTLLSQVYSQAALIATVNSFYVNGNKVLYHLPKFNYKYKITEIEYTVADLFLSDPIDPENPFYPFINNSPDMYTYRMILEKPSITYRLPDVIYGIILQQSFSVTLKNQNGEFDIQGNNLYFNRRARLKKTTT